MQKGARQKRFEVLDEKLDELIGRYGASVLMCADKIEISSQDYEICQDERKKAMQAIIEYHNKKVQEATKYIREVYEKYKNRPLTPYGDSPSDAIGCKLKVQDLWQAIKKTVEGE